MHSLPVHGSLIVPKWPYQVYVCVSCFFGGGNLLSVLLIPCATMWSPYLSSALGRKDPITGKVSWDSEAFDGEMLLGPSGQIGKDMFWPGEARACDLTFLYFRLVVSSNHMRLNFTIAVFCARGPKTIRVFTKEICFVKLVIWNIAATCREKPISRKFLLWSLTHEFQLYQSHQQENSNNGSKNKTKPTKPKFFCNFL